MQSLPLRQRLAAASSPRQAAQKQGSMQMVDEIGDFSDDDAVMATPASLGFSIAGASQQGISFSPPLLPILVVDAYLASSRGSPTGQRRRFWSQCRPERGSGRESVSIKVTSAFILEGDGCAGPNHSDVEHAGEGKEARPGGGAVQYALSISAAERARGEAVSTVASNSCFCRRASRRQLAHGFFSHAAIVCCR